MVRNLLLTGAVVTAVLSAPAFAQSNHRVIREASPTQRSNVVLANSPQDLALQEEIRRIRAYNAHIDRQVGISDGVVQGQQYNRSYNTGYSSYTVAAPQTPVANRYTGRKVELYAPAPQTQLSYASATGIPSTQQTYGTRLTYSTGQSHDVTQAAAVVRRDSPVQSIYKYQVISGDTLYSLAKVNCVSVSDIRNYNRIIGNSISLGQTLDIPTGQCHANAAPVQTSITRNVDSNTHRNLNTISTSTRATQINDYAVLPKDTLYSIGRRYCLTATDLARFNGIRMRDSIQPGQILSLPSSACK